MKGLDSSLTFFFLFFLLLLFSVFVRTIFNVFSVHTLQDHVFVLIRTHEYLAILEVLCQNPVGCV